MHFQFREKERPDDFVSNLVGRMRVFYSTYNKAERMFKFKFYPIETYN
jgi:hypothetical protein